MNIIKRHHSGKINFAIINVYFLRKKQLVEFILIMGIRLEQNFCDFIEHKDKLFSSDDPLSLQVVFIQGFFIFDSLSSIKYLAKFSDGKFMIKDTSIDHKHEGLTKFEYVSLCSAEGEDESVDFALLCLLHGIIFHSLLYILLL